MKKYGIESNLKKLIFGYGNEKDPDDKTVNYLFKVLRRVINNLDERCNLNNEAHVLECLKQSNQQIYLSKIAFLEKKKKLDKQLSKFKPSIRVKEK